jgi:hypothetical protein
MKTSNMLVNGGFAAVLPLGDNQYYCGGYQAFTQSYDASWGRVKTITYPAVGNHEYLTSGGRSTVGLATSVLRQQLGTHPRLHSIMGAGTSSLDTIGWWALFREQLTG